MKIIAFLPLLSLLIGGAHAMGRKKSSSESEDASSDDFNTGYFEGYWAGIDPNDGGDSRRTVIKGRGNSYDLVGRDTVLSLCGGTERGTLNAMDGGFDSSGNLVFRGPLICNEIEGGKSVNLIYTMSEVDDDLMMENLVNADTGTQIYNAYFWRLVSP